MRYALALAVLMLTSCTAEPMPDPDSKASAADGSVATAIASGGATTSLWESAQAFADCSLAELHGEKPCNVGLLGTLTDKTRVAVLERSPTCGKMARVRVESGPLSGVVGCVPRGSLEASGYYLPNGH
jgi:hypothetical protein